MKDINAIFKAFLCLAAEKSTSEGRVKLFGFDVGWNEFENDPHAHKI
jgi:hypothetical protein